MARGLIFWILMLIWFVFSAAVFGGFTNVYMLHASTFLEFVLFLLLGWQVYGPPVRG